MEATGLVVDAGGVNVISTGLLGSTEMLDGLSVVTGIVAFAAVVGMICEVGTSDVGVRVGVLVTSEVGIGVSRPVVTAVLSPVGVGVTPVPTEVPAVGVMPGGVSDGGLGLPTGVVGVLMVVSSDVGMGPGRLVSGVGTGDPAVDPVGMVGVGRIDV